MNISKGAICFFLVILLFGGVSALGISPSSKEYNFRPGLTQSITFEVKRGTNMDLKLEVGGDLAEYIILDKYVLGPGDNFFTATISLPRELDDPGRHKSFVRISEKVDEELAQSFISATVSLKAIIDVYVPYPGQYLEINLSSHDVNVGQPVEFRLDVNSRGENGVLMSPVVHIYDSQSFEVGSLAFTSREIGGQKTLSLKKTFDTIGLNPGNYRAEAVIEYGAIAKASSLFRIGSLNINLVNYSNLFYIDRLVPFDLIVESSWNDNIEGAYAEIVFFNDTWKGELFKTSPTSLTPWERKKIQGFFDSSQFVEGVYSANITLTYFGGGNGASNSQIANVFFQKRPVNTLWYYLGGAGILLLAILICLKYFVFRRKYGKKKRK